MSACIFPGVAVIGAPTKCVSFLLLCQKRLPICTVRAAAFLLITVVGHFGHPKYTKAIRYSSPPDFLMIYTQFYQGDI